MLSLGFNYKKIIGLVIIGIIFFSVFFLVNPKITKASECEKISDVTGINKIKYHYYDADKNSIFTSIALKNGNTESTTWAYQQTLEGIEYFFDGKKNTGNTSLKVYKNTGGTLADTYIIVKDDNVLGTYRFFAYGLNETLKKEMIFDESPPQNISRYLFRLDWAEYPIRSRAEYPTFSLMNTLEKQQYYKYAAFQQCRGTTPIEPYRALHEINLKGDVDYRAVKPAVNLRWTYLAHVTNTQYSIMRKEKATQYVQLKGNTRVVIDPYTNIPTIHYIDDTVEKGKEYTYQIQLSHTSQYKSNEITFTIKSNPSTTDKECSELINNYKVKNAEVRLLNSQIAGGDNTKKEDLEKKLSEIKALKETINSKCGKDGKDAIEGIDDHNQQIINDANTNVVTAESTPTDCENDYCKGDMSRFPQKFVCQSLCWINEAIMGFINWAFELLKSAISTNTKSPYEPKFKEAVENAIGTSGTTGSSPSTPGGGTTPGGGGGGSGTIPSGGGDDGSGTGTETPTDNPEPGSVAETQKCLEDCAANYLAESYNCETANPKTTGCETAAKAQRDACQNRCYGIYEGGIL